MAKVQLQTYAHIYYSDRYNEIEHNPQRSSLVTKDRNVCKPYIETITGAAAKINKYQKMLNSALQEHRNTSLYNCLSTTII